MLFNASAVLESSLVKKRKQAGLSQRELGEKLKPPVSQKTISGWESGRTTPPSYYQTQLAELGLISENDIQTTPTNREIVTDFLSNPENLKELAQEHALNGFPTIALIAQTLGVSQFLVRQVSIELEEKGLLNLPKERVTRSGIVLNAKKITGPKQRIGRNKNWISSLKQSDDPEVLKRILASCDRRKLSASDKEYLKRLLDALSEED